ncbi:dyslexia-associated protein KIAA0319-like protein [Leptotrombidium deliense]|uniref:Dyslexia-associated protein KIAA0319-like protein n=1 Tax=Leptotrombidium deliense TaxID=299467 RepID=A0A443SIX2_9ACAR|nr:dyslexia-associated protein KIAA0319-like protein [Leptotrombidium deliense]
MFLTRIALFQCFVLYLWAGERHAIDLCPERDFELKVWKNVVPVHWKDAGNYTKNNDANDLISCLESCCNDRKCDAILFHKKSCFLITCDTDDACQPKRNLDDTQDVAIVLVRSADKRKFDEALSKYDDQLYSPVLSKFDHRRKDDSILPSFVSNDDTEHGIEESVSNNDEAVISSTESNTETISSGKCISDEQCGKNAVCFKKSNVSIYGECNCIKQYIRNESIGKCVPSATETLVLSNYVSAKPVVHVAVTPTTTTEAPFVKLAVAVQNRTISLPENSVVLSAFVIPKNNYTYQWTLVNHPSGEETGQMKDVNTANLTLTQLRQGNYTLQVQVLGKRASGSTFVTVTVLPPKRVNKPPVVIIQPSNSTVQLPNKETFLDGSASYDDDKIVSYKWESVVAPIDYKQPPGLEMNTSTLQLKNLIPGFFQYQLTVIDSDGASSSAVANITVFKETDYPPTANAGADVIIHLPVNEVTLNGNTSTDDKGIVGWLWVRSPDDEKGKAVDMEGTTTPYLHLSKLELGVYKFILKVTDTANQTSKAEVHVFVKPEMNTIPTANAGENKQVSLPLESPVVLDGSKSKDASPEGIVRWYWNQTSGPKPAALLNATKARTQVDGLIPGLYTFMLTVSNAKGYEASAKVNVTVTQTKNLPPTAAAGGEITLTLPCSIISINGSNSKDDVEIVSYKWTREPGSLAAGNIVEKTDTSPVLQVVDLVAGRYLFKLTVSDAQGAMGSDIAAVIVKPSPTLKDEIEVTLNIDITSFTEDQKMNTVKKLELLLNDAKSEQLKFVNIRVTPETVTNR